MRNPLAFLMDDSDDFDTEGYLDPRNIGGFLAETGAGFGRGLSNLVQTGMNDPGDLIEAATGALGEMHPLDQAAIATGPIPGLGDVVGLAADARMYYEEPETRTPGNYALTAAGMLPWVPPAVASVGAMGYLAKQGGRANAPTSREAQRGALGDFEPAEAVTAIDESKMVSTRMPWAKPSSNPPDPHKSLLLADMDALNLPEAEKMRSVVADTIRTYPGMGRLSPDATDAEVMTEFHKFTKDNLLEVYDRMPPEMRDAAKQWYEGANKIRGGLASEYGISDESASAVIAALSPKTDWDKNLSMAERIIDTWSTQKNTPYSAEMSKAGRRRKKEGGFVIAQDRVKRVEGKMLSELDDPNDQATWIRLYDDAHNDGGYVNWNPDGSRGAIARNEGGAASQTGVGNQSFDAIRKAVSVLEDPSARNISEELGGAHKVRNFYNNIENPLSDKFVTSDTHNAAAALGRPLSLKSPEVLSQFGGKGGGSNAYLGMKGTYAPIAEANRAAGAEVGLRPGQMQSVPWVGIRKMFDKQMKTKWGKLESSPTDKIWGAYDRGDITHQEAWDMIEEATGGMAKRKAPYLNPNF